jgi:general secretion pathway protein A
MFCGQYVSLIYFESIILNGGSHGMYVGYFKLSEPPFSLTPDPQYLYMSARHREGLAHLLYGVQQPGGFVQLTGEVGSGKTTLCRCLIRQLPPDTDVALILNPRLTAIELLATVCDELRIPYPRETDSIKVLIDALNQRLLETHAQGKRTVLIIDEAQNLNGDVLEQIRLLTNLETSQEKLLQIILIGQPELLSMLQGEKLRQLAQRITARYHLLPLNRRETYAYIHHRLVVAGRRDPLFTSRGMRCVYRLSRGMPRVINIICDRALLGAYALDTRRIGARIVRRASRETQGRIPTFRRQPLAWIAGILILIALTAGGAIWLRSSHPHLFHWNGASTKVSEPIRPLPAKDVPDGKASTSPRLADILGDSSGHGNTDAAFASLYAVWGIQFPSNQSGLGCKAGESQGLRCLSLTGSWPRLRRFDLPAIIELTMPNGKRHSAALMKLDSAAATLVIGDRRYVFPLQEIDLFWDGSFLLLWKPPFRAEPLSPGMRGKGVAWVREALDRLEGKKPNPETSDLYDENLRAQVMAFQRERLLIPDGYVGNETLVRLTLALEGSKAVSISHQSR